MKPLRHLSFFIFGVIIFGLILGSFWSKKNAQASSFDQNNLISNGEFIDTNSMNSAEIQRFLESKGSYLKDFSEGGRSAAQIIWDASHGYGDASGSINGISITSSTGTVSPKVLLVTLQKEQSLISKTTRDDTALNKAMGYGCPDSGSYSSAYAGFTKQVEWSAWQFRYNYERAEGAGFSDYQVAGSATFSDWNGIHNVTFSNRATSALYRYTPHVYNGNYNFWNLFYNTYDFELSLYSFQIISQGPYSGPGSAQDPMTPGQSVQLFVILRNTGSQAWHNSESNPTHLGMSSPRDGGSRFTGGRNERMVMDETTVASGSNGTFRLNVTAPDQPGVYIEHFDMVVEGIKWIGSDTSWRITVGNPLSARYVVGGQEPYTADAKVHLYPGQSATLTARFVNTSGANWYNSSANPINLGSSGPHDRVNPFTHNVNVRGSMREWGVANGQTGTFDMVITAPNQTGTYNERYDLVVDKVGWIDTGLYWVVVVE